MDHGIPYCRRRGLHVARVGMTGVMRTMTFLACGLAEVPIVNEWAYAWSVEHFLRSGSLQMVDQRGF
jgi:hypothetical protein